MSRRGRWSWAAQQRRRPPRNEQKPEETIITPQHTVVAQSESARRRHAFEARWYGTVWPKSGNPRRRVAPSDARPPFDAATLQAACDDAFPEQSQAWFDDALRFRPISSGDRLRRTAQQPLRGDLALVVPNLRVRHRVAENLLVCTVDGREITRVSQDAGPDEAAAFLDDLRDDLGTRVAQFSAWSPEERTVWLLRRLGITVLFTGRQRSWISSPTVWVVSRQAPLDQVNRLLLEVLAGDRQWWQHSDPADMRGYRRLYQPDDTVWQRLDLMLFLVLGAPAWPTAKHRGTVEGCYRELCRLIGFADRTTLLRRFARRALQDDPWVYDVRLDWFTQLRATLTTTGVGRVKASVATRTGASERWTTWSESFSTSA